jgi:hypothetical protein
VQPHLKKCFEGIARLEFTEQQEIVGMIPSEKETVPFSQKIVPAKAKVCCQFPYCREIKISCAGNGGEMAAGGGEGDGQFFA